jgi:hypothetical protein
MKPISNEQIDQYKSYFKRLNIEQYGAGVLMNALNEGKNADPLLGGQTNGTDLASMFPETPATVNINSEAVKKKLWQDLELEIKTYEQEHPEVKGQYMVAVNADTADGQPKFKIAKIDDVLALIPENDRAASKTLIAEHPVQIFKSSTIDVDALAAAPLADLENLIAGFLGKNQGVFQYLNSQDSQGAQAATGA